MKIKVLGNQGLLQTLEKFQVLQTWIFFQFVTWIFFQIYGINLAFFSRWRPRKNPGFQDLNFFLRFETDLDFSRPWFSEIKVQIKRPSVTEIFDNLQPFQPIIIWIFILSWLAIL